jgi:hypothetical protein
MIHVGSKGSPEGTSEYFRKMIPMGRPLILFDFVQGILRGLFFRCASLAVFPIADYDDRSNYRARTNFSLFHADGGSWSLDAMLARRRSGD